MNRVFSCRRPRVYWRYLVVLNDNVADFDFVGEPLLEHYSLGHSHRPIGHRHVLSLDVAIHLEALAHQTTRFFLSISYSALMPLSEIYLVPIKPLVIYPVSWTRFQLIQHKLLVALGSITARPPSV
ncbi:hypothetical protein KCU91_g128, partial [Aureobasidium melanogenum]